MGLPRYIMLLAAVSAMWGCEERNANRAPRSLRTYQADADAFRQISADTGPELCEASRGCEVGDRINVLVAHNAGVIIGSMTGALLEVDSLGRTVTTVARRGKGPGEFIWPGTADFDSVGELRVFDVALRRMVVFDRDLHPISTSAAYSGHSVH